MNKEKYTIILNANDPKYIIPIDGNLKDIIYYIDFNVYLNQIQKTYFVSNSSDINHEQIWKEFSKDIYRCDLKINEQSYKNPTDVYTMLLNKYPKDITYKTMMFATPDSLAFPCEILRKVFTNVKEPLYVAELNDKRRYFRINITTSENSIGFVFDKNLRLIDENGNSRYHVYIKIEFNLFNKNPVLLNFTLKHVKPH